MPAANSVRFCAPGGTSTGVPSVPGVPAGTPERVATSMCQTAKNMAAIAGPMTNPLMPKTAMPPTVVIMTT